MTWCNKQIYFVLFSVNGGLSSSKLLFDSPKSHKDLQPRDGTCEVLRQEEIEKRFLVVAVGEGYFE